MKTLSFLLILLLTVLFVGCNSKPSEPQGDPYLLNAAKNSQQAKDAEAAVNDAAAKVKAKTDAAIQQAEEINKIEE